MYTAEYNGDPSSHTHGHGNAVQKDNIIALIQSQSNPHKMCTRHKLCTTVGMVLVHRCVITGDMKWQDATCTH